VGKMSSIYFKFQEFKDEDEEKLLNWLDKKGYHYEFMSDIY